MLARIKLRRIDFCFLLDHNRQTGVYILGLGPPDVLLQRNCDSLTEEDNFLLYISKCIIYEIYIQNKLLWVVIILNIIRHNISIL